MKSATANHPRTSTAPSFKEVAVETLKALRKRGDADILLSHAMTTWIDDKDQVIVADVSGNTVAVVDYNLRVALL